MSTGDGPRPLTRQRSPWEPRRPLVIEGTTFAVWSRNVNDGRLNAVVGTEPPDGRWHLSVSHSKPKGGPGRYPRWDEITDARYRLMPDDFTGALLLPPPENYVAEHPTTFHVHEIDWPPGPRSKP